MIGSMRAGFSPIFNLVLLAVFAVLGTVLMWIVSADVRNEISNVSTARIDNAQWALAQTEVEFLVLQAAVEQAILSQDEDLSQVRRRVDVFYARAATTKNSWVLRELDQNNDVA